MHNNIAELLQKACKKKGKLVICLQKEETDDKYDYCEILFFGYKIY